MAPVQEMSDARQALQAARIAGADGPTFQGANDLLKQAETHLANGEYDQARRLAIQSKDKALQARQEQKEN